MTNLYKETSEILKENNKTWEDVEFIKVQYEDEPKLLDIETFKRVAKKINYYANNGGTVINEALLIVGKDWWLERNVYYGTEWWVFKTKSTIEPIDKISNEEEVERLILGEDGSL